MKFVYISIAVFMTQIIVVSATQVNAQGFGGGGGFGGSGSYSSGSYDNDYGLGQTLRQSPAVSHLFPYMPEQALKVIQVDGSVEIRVQPEKLRVVLALTSEGETAEECQQKIKTQTTAIREDWLMLGILEQEIVEDFISVLPRYEWTAGKWEEENIRIQAHNGYRMQSNLHVAVNDEASAMRAIDAAFRHGLAEVVTFDYWTADLTEQKTESDESSSQTGSGKGGDPAQRVW